MRLYYSIWLVAAIAAVCCSAQDDSNKYVTLQVVDANNFCTFLPPTDSTDRNIADTEYMGNVFCMGNTPKASSAGPIPSGFIQSAHYVATDNYVQVTGQIDPSKANLNATDDGGQYDVAMPRGATCAGWQFFVNLIEPAGHTFCIRCCNSKLDCNRGISEKGCARIVPGDYSGPIDSNDPAATPSSSSSSSLLAPASASSSSSSSSMATKPSLAAVADHSVSAQSVDSAAASLLPSAVLALSMAVVGALLA